MAAACVRSPVVRCICSVVRGRIFLCACRGRLRERGVAASSRAIPSFRCDLVSIRNLCFGVVGCLERGLSAIQ